MIIEGYDKGMMLDIRGVECSGCHANLKFKRCDTGIILIESHACIKTDNGGAEMFTEDVVCSECSLCLKTERRGDDHRTLYVMPHTCEGRTCETDEPSHVFSPSAKMKSIKGEIGIMKEGETPLVLELNTGPKLIAYRKTHFHAAHFLPEHKGKCKHLHGHTYYLEVGVSYRSEDHPNDLMRNGMVVDFSVLDSILSNMVNMGFDHHTLNDLHSNPTAENLVIDVIVPYLHRKGKFEEHNLILEVVRLWETDNSMIEWRRM